MRSTKTTIRFKLSRAEDARALEYLRNRKAAGSSFSKSVVQAINDCLDAQEAESREDSFMGRFRLMLREELKAAGNAASFQPVHEISQPSQENAEQTLAFLDAFDGMGGENDGAFSEECRRSAKNENAVPSYLQVCDGRIGKCGGTFDRKRRQKGELYGKDKGAIQSSIGPKRI